MNVSIIIQGPICGTSLDAIPYYQSLGCEVIVSCWNGDDLDIISKKKIKGIKIVTSIDNPEIMHKSLKNRLFFWGVYRRNPVKKYDNYLYTCDIYNFGNAYRQVKTTIEGLRIAQPSHSSKRHVAIKIRSDQAFYKLDSFIEMCKSSPDMLTVSNLVYRHPNFAQYAIGDHIIGSSIEVLYEVFSLVLLRITDASCGWKWRIPNPGHDYIRKGRYFERNSKDEDLSFELKIAHNVEDLLLRGFDEHEIEYLCTRQRKKAQAQRGIDINDLGPENMISTAFLDLVEKNHADANHVEMIKKHFNIIDHKEMGFKIVEYKQKDYESWFAGNTHITSIDEI